MQDLDIFICKKVKNIDLFLNQLTLNADIEAYEKLILHSVLENMFAIVHSAIETNSIQLDTIVDDMLKTSYALAENYCSLDATVEIPSIKKYIDSVRNEFSLSSEVSDALMISLVAANDNNLTLGCISEFEVDIKKYSNLENELGLSIFADYEKILAHKYLSVESSLIIDPQLTEYLKKFIASDESVSISVSLGEANLYKHRTFADIEDFTINDIVNMNMTEFIMIQQ